MTVEEKIKAISSDDFAAFLSGDVAYVKHVEKDGMSGFAVHAADGQLLTILADREVAFATCRQNGLEPLSVH
jgi:hypothetical protein